VCFLYTNGVDIQTFTNQTFVNFIMAVATDQNAFVEFDFHSLPRPPLTLAANTKIFLTRVKVVEF